MNNPDDLYGLSTAFMRDHLAWMNLASLIAPLAVHLAEQACEEATRPLSADQLRRALDVLQEEGAHLRRLQFDHWNDLHRSGDLPERAGAVTHAQHAEELRLEEERKRDQDHS